MGQFFLEKIEDWKEFKTSPRNYTCKIENCRTAYKSVTHLYQTLSINGHTKFLLECYSVGAKWANYKHL